jgi:hypothetical protein
MSNKTPNKQLAPGDRVRLLEMPFKDHTGTIIKRGRFLFTKVWVVELDQPAGRGGGIARVKKAQKLTPETDPRRFRTT